MPFSNECCDRCDRRYSREARGLQSPQRDRIKYQGVGLLSLDFVKHVLRERHTDCKQV